MLVEHLLLHFIYLLFVIYLFSFFPSVSCLRKMLSLIAALNRLKEEVEGSGQKSIGRMINSLALFSRLTGAQDPFLSET
jgi:hypothetical protein